MRPPRGALYTATRTRVYSIEPPAARDIVSRGKAISPAVCARRSHRPTHRPAPPSRGPKVCTRPVIVSGGEGVPGTPYLTAWANAGKSGREQMASPRDPGRFPVFATCPVVISAHSQTIANQGEKKAGHCEFHSSRKTSSTASSPWPFKIHSRPLQPRPEWGGMLEPGGAGPRPERSDRPRIFRAPAG